MSDLDVDVVLQGSSDDIFPSSGFLDSVMVAVESEAVSLPAITFPWKRALPGLLVSAAVLIVLLAAALSAGLSPQVWSVKSAPRLTCCKVEMGLVNQEVTLWATLATILSFICLASTRRLPSRR